MANVTFIFDSLAGDADADVSLAEDTGVRRALAGVPLPAVMTAYRIGFRFMWEQTSLAEAHARHTDGLDPGCHVADLHRPGHLHPGYDRRLPPTADRPDPRARRRSDRRLVEAMLFGRITDSQSLWEAADLLRLPTSGPYVVVAAQAAGDRKDWPTRRSKTSSTSATSGRRGGCCPTCRSASSICVDRRIRRGADRRVACLRLGPRRRQPEFHDLADTGEALRFARWRSPDKTSDQQLVAVFDDSPLAFAAVSAPEVMARIRSKAAWPPRRPAGRGTRGSSSRPSRLGSTPAVPPTTTAAKIYCPPKHRAAPAAPHRGTHRPIAVAAARHRRVVPGIRGGPPVTVIGNLCGHDKELLTW